MKLSPVQAVNPLLEAGARVFESYPNASLDVQYELCAP